MRITRLTSCSLNRSTRNTSSEREKQRVSWPLVGASTFIRQHSPSYPQPVAEYYLRHEKKKDLSLFHFFLTSSRSAITKGRKTVKGNTSLSSVILTYQWNRKNWKKKKKTFVIGGLRLFVSWNHSFNCNDFCQNVTLVCNPLYTELGIHKNFTV